MRKYIYGVISSSKPATFGQSFLSSSPEQVYTVSDGDLACVVSDYNGDDFASLSKEDKLLRLMTHQETIERVMKEHSILPVKFGTMAEDEDEIRCILAQGYEKLSQALNQTNSLVEIEVAATWDLKKVLEEIGSKEEIGRLKRFIAGKSAGEVLEMQINAGMQIKECLDRRREGYYSQTMQSLAETALDTQANALVSDEMVMNVAFLVERERQDDFDNQVRQIDEAFDGQINFRVIGPLPPYSFSTVQISRPDLEKIEQARQLLGLGTDVSAKELKEAYRHLAAKSHPDAHLAGDADNERFARVREAFVLLRDYCRGQSSVGKENMDGQRHSLMPGDLGRAFLVDIKRPAVQTAE